MKHGDAWMTTAELAEALNMSMSTVTSELQRDAQLPRKERFYVFANPNRSKDTGTWNYRIHRKRFERWNDGYSIT